MPAWSEWASLLDESARRLLGEPNQELSSPQEGKYRYGTRGSTAVDLTCGTWFSHENAIGGGALDLIAQETGRDPLDWIREQGLERYLPGHEGNGANGGGDRRQPQETAGQQGQRSAAGRGKPRGTLEKVYDYVNAAGTVVFQTVRFRDPKDFRQRRPDGRGGWTWNLQGVELVPYRLPELIPADIVYICEGEKDADTVRGLGLVATCNPMGASKWRKMSLSLSPWFEKKSIYILGDNDEAGRKNCEMIAQELSPVAKRIKIVSLPVTREGEDVTDWIQLYGGTAEKLKELCYAAEIYSLRPTQIVVPLRDAAVQAELFLSARHPRLLRHQEQFYDWTESCYIPQSKEDLEVEARRWLRTCFIEKDGRLRPYPVDTRAMNEFLKALPSVSNFAPTSSEIPSWLDNRLQPPPDKLINFPNGYLDLETEEFSPPTEKLFITSTCGFDYDPDAPAPARFLQFLDQIFAGDTEQIALLQQIFGYCITWDTSLQKLFLVVGPARSGKGTLLWVLSNLWAPGSVASFTLKSLGDDRFALEPFIGKPLAFITDARLGPRTDTDLVTEYLLGPLSGEDAVDVRRMYKPHWHGRLKNRVIITSNELPQFRDITGTLATRFVPLQTRESYLGREDYRLKTDLMPEMPGILLWALDGLQDLRAAGRFMETELSRMMSVQIARSGSDILTFMDEHCYFGVEYGVTRDRLYGAYVNFCRRNNTTRILPLRHFWSQFRAACAGKYEITDHRPRTNDPRRPRVVRGVAVGNSETDRIRPDEVDVDFERRLVDGDPRIVDDDPF